jgi:hypothetical protein
MADIEITQAEADALMQMEKRCAEEKEWLFPAPGQRLAIPLTSIDKREKFYARRNPRPDKAYKSEIPKPGTASDHPDAAGYRRSTASKS